MKKIGIIVFICAMAFGVVFSYVFSPGDFRFGLFSFGRGVAGSGVLKKQKIEAADFTAIEAGGSFKVEMTARKEFDVEVEADDNLLQYINVYVDGVTLKIETEKSISSRNPLVVRISAPGIESIESNGAAQISLANAANERLSVNASGASRVSLEGTTKELNAELSGASKIEAENFRAENAVIGASGASRADVFVSNDLKADASGASKVYYSGSPKDVAKDVSGAACVREKKAEPCHLEICQQPGRLPYAVGLPANSN